MNQKNIQFLNTDEAAEFLRVKRSTIYAWVRQGKIPFRKHGAKTVFVVEDLLQWSENQVDSRGQGANGVFW